MFRAKWVNRVQIRGKCAQDKKQMEKRDNLTKIFFRGNAEGEA